MHFKCSTKTLLDVWYEANYHNIKTTKIDGEKIVISLIQNIKQKNQDKNIVMDTTFTWWMEFIHMNVHP
jgi:hypothetical protein